MTIEPLPEMLIRSIVERALREDLGRAGDLTSEAVVSPDARLRAAVVARQPGVIAGTAAAALAFRALDPEVSVAIERADGAPVAAGDTVMQIAGRARAMLSAERTALNLLCHLSGIATATATLVALVAGHQARIVCTRKTTPGLRSLEKHAVRAGGGHNHRFGLDDAVLIKDNHIAAAGGLRRAVERARARVGHLVRIEVEVDTLAQLTEALEAGVDTVLLDNMAPETLRRAVTLVDGRALTEASGRITADSVAEVAATGVDIISVGWITHSAPILDLGLDIAGGA